jgi:hypothetical protein
MDLPRSASIALALAAAYVAHVGYRKLREKGRFEVTPAARETHKKAADLLTSRDGQPSYQEWRAAVPNADPVQYHDLKKLWSGGAQRFTPENVQRNM